MDVFEQALAGDAALRDFLDGTVVGGQNTLEQQQFPAIESGVGAGCLI